MTTLKRLFTVGAKLASGPRSSETFTIESNDADFISNMLAVVIVYLHDVADKTPPGYPSADLMRKHADRCGDIRERIEAR